MEVTKRKSVFESLQKYCTHATEDDYVEITEWSNGEGYDINVTSKLCNQTISVTYGEFQAIKKMVKFLNKHID